MKRDIAAMLTIASFMQRHGLSQKATATSMGLTISGISRVLSNDRRVKFTEAVAFCDANKISLADFEAMYWKIKSNTELQKEAQDAIDARKNARGKVQKLLACL